MPESSHAEIFRDRAVISPGLHTKPIVIYFQESDALVSGFPTYNVYTGVCDFI